MLCRCPERERIEYETCQWMYKQQRNKMQGGIKWSFSSTTNKKEMCSGEKIKNSKHDSGTTEKPAMVTFYKSSCSLSSLSDFRHWNAGTRRYKWTNCWRDGQRTGAHLRETSQWDQNNKTGCAGNRESHWERGVQETVTPQLQVKSQLSHHTEQNLRLGCFLQMLWKPWNVP